MQSGMSGCAGVINAVLVSPICPCNRGFSTTKPSVPGFISKNAKWFLAVKTLCKKCNRFVLSMLRKMKRLKVVWNCIGSWQISESHVDARHFFEFRNKLCFGQGCRFLLRMLRNWIRNIIMPYNELVLAPLKLLTWKTFFLIFNNERPPWTCNDSLCTVRKKFEQQRSLLKDC